MWCCVAWNRADGGHQVSGYGLRVQIFDICRQNPKTETRWIEGTHQNVTLRARQKPGRIFQSMWQGRVFFAHTVIADPTPGIHWTKGAPLKVIPVVRCKDSWGSTGEMNNRAIVRRKVSQGVHTAPPMRQRPRVFSQVRSMKSLPKLWLVSSLRSSSSTQRAVDEVYATKMRIYTRLITISLARP